MVDEQIYLCSKIERASPPKSMKSSLDLDEGFAELDGLDGRD